MAWLQSTSHLQHSNSCSLASLCFRVKPFILQLCVDVKIRFLISNDDTVKKSGWFRVQRWRGTEAKIVTSWTSKWTQNFVSFSIEWRWFSIVQLDVLLWSILMSFEITRSDFKMNTEFCSFLHRAKMVFGCPISCSSLTNSKVVRCNSVWSNSRRIFSWSSCAWYVYEVVFPCLR